MKIILKILLIAFLFYIAFVEPPIKAQVQGQPVENLSGEELFIQNRCVRCHTIGRGRFVGPDLAEVNKRYTKEEIIKWIENPQQIYQSSGKMPVNEGYPPMPPTNIPPAQVGVIAEYLLSFDIPSDRASLGSISGQVVNKTIDGPAPHTELSLTSFMGDRSTDNVIIQSDEQGNYLFKDLPWDRSYSITVNFKGAQYSTDKMVFNPNEDTKILNLPIFEPTVKDTDIKVRESHMIVQEVEGGTSVADITLYDNTSDKIYVGGKDLKDGRKESLRITTPSTAQNINFVHGVKPDDLVKTNYGYADTNSIMPGQKRIVYTYDLPSDSSTTSLEKLIDYPTENFLLLISETEKVVEVEGLSGGESVPIQQDTFLKWTGENLQPGHKIKIEIKNTFLSDANYLKWGVLGFLLLIIIAGIIYSSLIKKSFSEPDQEKREEDIEEKRLSLIKEIAELDDSFEAGQIDEKEYKKIRESKKNNLKKIIRRL